MYQIRFGDALLLDQRIPGYSLIDPVYTPEVGKVHGLSFTLPKEHVNAGAVKIMTPEVKLYKRGKLVFKGRAYAEKTNFYGDTKYTCEDCMAFLQDSQIKPFDFSGTAAEFFEKIVTEHNSRVKEEQQIQLGNCTVEASISRSSESYVSAWEALNSRLVSYLGGYLWIRYDAQERPILDYLQDFTGAATQHVEYGENMQDYVLDRDAQDFYTAVIPLGAKLSDIDAESENDRRLTIESVNDGKDYLVNETLASLYGIVYAPTKSTTHDDVKLPQNLLARGQADLLQGITYKRTVSITAVDRSAFDTDYTAWSVGEYIVIDSAPHGGTLSYLFRKAKIDLNNPALESITLGDEQQSYVERTSQSIGSVAGQVEKIESEYRQEAATIANAAIEKNTSILQSAEQIMLEALREYTKTQDFTTFQEIVQTQLQVMAGQINLTFTNTTDKITDLAGETNRQFEQISKYIRFIDGSIVLGRTDSAIKLKISNDVLYFFAGGDTTADISTAFAYFASNRLTVRDVSALNSLAIGPFSWIPESNGSLSMVKM